MSYYNGSAYAFTWEGRRLVGAVKGSTNMSFTYNNEGIRTSKTVNGVTHTYYLNGSQITAEQWEDKLLVYLYDASGAPIGMMYRTTSYDIDEWDTFFFEKNLQGDIVTVYNSDGVACITYKYDAWGNFKESYIGNSPNAAWRNPFRYRGYYYDTDLGMYYLQSRYYDSNICRFINADSALYHSMLGYNLFAYCENNPVNYYDPTGEYADALNPWQNTAEWLALLALLDSFTPILETILIIGVASLAVAAVLNAAQNKTPEKTKDKPNDPPSSTTESKTPPSDVEVPDVKYPGDDPTVAPDGYEWTGPDPQGGKRGGYKNTDPGKRDSWHPDFNHGGNKGPHWDYNDIFGRKWGITQEFGKTVIRLWVKGKIIWEIFRD